MRKTKLNNIVKIILIALSIMILLFTVWSLGKPIKMPWPLSIEINQPKYASINQNACLQSFTDNDLMRLSYLDENEKISDYNEIDVMSNSYQRYYNVSSSLKKTYALHVFYDLNTGYINKEEIVCKFNNENNYSSIFTKQYDSKADKLKRPQILDIQTINDEPYILLMDNTKIEVCKIDNGLAVPIKSHAHHSNINCVQDGCYNFVCDKIVFTTYYGSIIQIDKNNEETVLNQQALFPYSCPAVSDDGKVYVNDLTTKDLYCFKNGVFKVVANNINPHSTQFEYGNLVVCDAESDSVLIFDDKDTSKAFDNDTIAVAKKTITSIPFSPNLIFYIGLIWISYIYLFVLLVVLLVKLVRKIKSSEKTKLYIGASFIIALTVIGISAFFTSNIYMQAENSMSGNLKTATLSAVDSNMVNFEKLHADNMDIKSQIFYHEAICKNLEKNIDNFAQGNNALDIDYVNISERDELIYKDYNKQQSSYSKITSAILESLKSNNLNDVIITKLQLEQGTTLAAIKAVQDNDGMIQGLMITTYPTNRLRVEQINNTIGLSVILIIAIATILLIGMELMSFRKSLINSIKVKTKKIKGQTEILGSRIFSFLYHLIYCIDVALLVLIAKDIFSANGLESAALALSAPASLYALGAFFGTTIARKILEKFYARNMFVMLASIHFICELIIVFSIVISNFPLFCIFKFITGVTFGAISFSVNVIQYQTKNLKDQAIVANDSALALISSSALSTMIAGWLADSFGNEAIYVFTATICLLFIAASFWFIPKKIYFSDKKSINNSKNEKQDKKAIFKFIFSPSMIVILLCTCFISAIAYQYNSILFPLYADQAGLSKSQIGNIVMICICIVFFVNNIIKKILVSKKQTTIVKIAMLCFAIPLLCFALNHSIIWSCITLAFITFAYRTIVVSQKLIWVPLAKKANMPQNKIYMIATQVKMVSTSIAPTIFMAFMSFGAAQAAFAVGLICFLCFLIFICFVLKIN